LIPVLQTVDIVFLGQSVWKVVYTAQIQRNESPKLLMNGQHPHDCLVEAIPWFNYIKSDYRAINHHMYVDGFHNSMLNDKDGYEPSPQIMFSCTALLRALLEWQEITGVHQKAFK
jgi:hypothetical protein